MHGIDLDTPLSDEQVAAALDSFARKIVARRLETPAVLFLEMHKPLSYVASQGMLVAMPFLAPFVGAQGVADLSKLARDRANVEKLIERIEELAAERDAPAAEGQH